MVHRTRRRKHWLVELAALRKSTTGMHHRLTLLKPDTLAFQLRGLHTTTFLLAFHALVLSFTLFDFRKQGGGGGRCHCSVKERGTEARFLLRPRRPLQRRLRSSSPFLFFVSHFRSLLFGVARALDRHLKRTLSLTRSEGGSPFSFVRLFVQRRETPLHARPAVPMPAALSSLFGPI